MPEEKAPDNSRQSVDLKWKTRKGIEENLAFEGNKTKVGGDLEVDGKIVANSGVVNENGKEKYITTEIGYANAQNVFGDKKGLESLKGLKGDDGKAIGFFSNAYGMGVGFTKDGRHSINLIFQSYSADWRYDLPTHSGTLATASDIKPLYRHSVALSATGKGEIHFDAYTASSEPIDSWQDLAAKLNGAQLTAVGYGNACQVAIGSTVGDSYYVSWTAGEQNPLTGFTQVYDSVSAVIAPVSQAKENPFPEEEEASPKAKKAVK